MIKPDSEPARSNRHHGPRCESGERLRRAGGPGGSALGQRMLRGSPGGRARTVSGQLPGSGPAGASGSLSHRRMLPGRRQLLLCSPRAAHPPPLSVHLSALSPPRRPLPSRVTSRLPQAAAEPRGQEPILQPPPQTCRRHAAGPGRATRPAGGGSASLTTWEQSTFRGGERDGFGNSKKRSKL